MQSCKKKENQLTGSPCPSRVDPSTWIGAVSTCDRAPDLPRTARDVSPCTDPPYPGLCPRGPSARSGALPCACRRFSAEKTAKTRAHPKITGSRTTTKKFAHIQKLKDQK